VNERSPPRRSIACESTRGGAPATTLHAAILAGLAPDGGLYMPTPLPRFDDLDAFDAAATLAEIAEASLRPFFAGDVLASHLLAACAAAYVEDAPLVPHGDGRTFELELFHGPTAAFKDYGARFLAACMQAAPHGGAAPTRRTVLVATSGDTGAAVGSAFEHAAGVRTVILHPDGMVSPRQAHQLGSFGGAVSSWRVQGTFDDCQRMVKEAFADADLRARHALTSANSISLARLLPQMGYFAAAALRHARSGGAPLSFAVPTGNLGDAVACILAKLVGFPIGKVLFAGNANRATLEWLEHGDTAPRATIATLANAMDVGAPSNLERLRALVAARPGLRADLEAGSVDDDAIRATIVRGWREAGRTWCPHTACAAHAVLGRRARGDAHPWAIVATAHPAKFETIVEPLLGLEVPVPPRLASMLARPSRSRPMPARLAALREALEQG
jgi:threonine synthase